MTIIRGRFRHLSLCGLAVLFLSVIPHIVKTGYYIHLFIYAFLFATLAMSFNLVFGYTGMMSLAHGAFFAVGGYVSGIVGKKLGMPFYLDFLASAVIVGAFAFGLGFATLRLAKETFVIATLAFYFVGTIVAAQWVSVTEGAMGIQDIPPPQLTIPYCADIRFTSRTSMYYLTLVFACLAVYLCVQLVNSPLGRVLVGIREDELLAEACGIDTFKYKLLVFTVGSIIAGMVGTLYVHYETLVSPSIFDFYYTSRVLVMTLVGGAGTIGGVLVGVVGTIVVAELLRFAPELREVLFGATLILVALFMPRGAGERIGSAVGWLRKKTHQGHF